MVYHIFDIGTPALGAADIVDDNEDLRDFATHNSDWMITHIGLTGGSAVMDSAIKVKLGKLTIATLKNQLTTPTLLKTELLQSWTPWREDQPLQLVCTDAAPAALKFHIAATPMSYFSADFSELGAMVHEDLGSMSLNDIDGMTLSENLKELEESAKPRKLIAAGISGGSAEGDSGIEISAGDTLLATLYNSITDETIIDDIMMPINAFVPAGKKLQIKCIDAFAADCHVGLKVGG
jgi:hypothetical protein